jgi:hypothetical protein
MSCNGKSNDSAADELDVFMKNTSELFKAFPKEHPFRVFQELYAEYVLLEKRERDPKKEPLSLVQLAEIKTQLDKHREVKRKLSLKMNSQFSLPVLADIVCIMGKMLELQKKLY